MVTTWVEMLPYKKINCSRWCCPHKQIMWAPHTWNKFDVKMNSTNLIYFKRKKFHVGKCNAELLCKQTHMIHDGLLRVWVSISRIWITTKKKYHHWSFPIKSREPKLLVLFSRYCKFTFTGKQCLARVTIASSELCNS